MRTGGKENVMIVELFSNSRNGIENILFEDEETTEIPQISINIDNETSNIISSEINKAGISPNLVVLLKEVCMLNVISRSRAITPLLDENILIKLVNSSEEGMVYATEILLLLFYIMDSLPVNAYILEFLFRTLYSNSLFKMKVPEIIDIGELMRLNINGYWRMIMVMIFMKMVWNIYKSSEEFVKLDDYINMKNQSFTECSLITFWQLATNSDIIASITEACFHYDLFSGISENIDKSRRSHLFHQIFPVYMILHLILSKRQGENTNKMETMVFLNNILMIQQLCKCPSHPSSFSNIASITSSSRNSTQDYASSLFPYINNNNNNNNSHKERTRIPISYIRSTVMLSRDYILNLCIDEENEDLSDSFNTQTPCERLLNLSLLCSKNGIFDLNLIFASTHQVYKMKEQRYRPKDKRYTPTSIRRAINTANKLFNAILSSIDYEHITSDLTKNHLIKGEKLRHMIQFKYEEEVTKILNEYIKYSTLDNKSSHEYWTFVCNATRKLTMDFQKISMVGNVDSIRARLMTQTSTILFPVPLKLVHLQLIGNSSIKSFGLYLVACYVFAYITKEKKRKKMQNNGEDGTYIFDNNDNNREADTINEMIMKDTILRLVKDGNPICRLFAVSQMSKYLCFGVRIKDNIDGNEGEGGSYDNSDNDDNDDNNSLFLDATLESINNSDRTNRKARNEDGNITEEIASSGSSSSCTSLPLITLNRFASIIMLYLSTDRIRNVRIAVFQEVFNRLKREYERLVEEDDVPEKAKMLVNINTTIFPMITKGILVLDSYINNHTYKDRLIEEETNMLRDAIILVMEILVLINKSNLLQLDETSQADFTLNDALIFCVQRILLCLTTDRSASSESHLYSLDIVPLDTLKRVIHRIAFITLTRFLGEDSQESEEEDDNDGDEIP